MQMVSLQCESCSDVVDHSYVNIREDKLDRRTSCENFWVVDDVLIH